MKLTPQVKSQELMLNSDFLRAIDEKSYARIGQYIQDHTRECFLELAYTLVDKLENDLIHRKVIDKSTIRDMRDQLRVVRYFKK